MILVILLVYAHVYPPRLLSSILLYAAVRHWYFILTNNSASRICTEVKTIHFIISVLWNPFTPYTVHVLNLYWSYSPSVLFSYSVLRIVYPMCSIGIQIELLFDLTCLWTTHVLLLYIRISLQGIGDSGQGFVNSLLFCVFTPKVRKQFLLLLINFRCFKGQCPVVLRPIISSPSESHNSLSSTFPVMHSKTRKCISPSPESLFKD